MRKMREYNFKASDNNGEMLMGLSFPFSFMGIAGLILILRLYLFRNVNNNFPSISNNILYNENCKKICNKKLSYI